VIIALNGHRAELPDGATVVDAVKEAGVEDDAGRGVAVAVDGEVIRRGEWGQTRLEGDQTVEVVRAVQGG
jgi:sulfur carrier protein